METTTEVEGRDPAATAKMMEQALREIQTGPLTLDDVRAAFKRGDFDSNECYNIARWAKQAQKIIGQRRLRGARVGDTLLCTPNKGGTPYQVRLVKVNQTKCEVEVIDGDEYPAGTALTCPMDMLEQVNA